MGDRRRAIKYRLIFQQNAGFVWIIAAWFLLNLVVFVAQGVPLEQALATLLFFREVPSGWGHFYAKFTEFIVFGLMISVITLNIQSRYKPEETCSQLAAESRDHTVVIGYSHLGQRIASALEQHGQPVVVVEPERGLVAPLIQKEHPLVLGGGDHRDILERAGVPHARLVALTSDDLEVVAVASSLVRQLNTKCRLLLRCPNDAVGEVLARTYHGVTVSTSRLAAKYVAKYAAQHRVTACLIIGCTNIGRRTLLTLKEKGVTATLVDPSEEAVADLKDEATVVVGSPSDIDTLKEAGAATADLVVLADDDLGANLIILNRLRSLNGSCRIICRVFHEEATAMLTHEPFRCEVISTSRHAFTSLVKDGVFRDVGLTK